MSKLTTPLMIVFAIAAALGIGGWRSSSSNHAAATTELTSTSNRLAEVTTKLAEQGAANQTLRIQLDLQKTDLAGYSNKMGSLQAKLVLETSRVAELEGIVRDRDAGLRAANQVMARETESVRLLESDVARQRGELESLRATVADYQMQLQVAMASLNAAESRVAALLQQLSDPAVLRAGLANATKAPKASGNAAQSSKLTMLPDGTIVASNSALQVPTRSTKPQSTSQPVFKEIPGITTP